MVSGPGGSRLKPYAGVIALLLAQAVAAGQAELPESTDDFIALMEFVAGWERHDGEWVDALSLEQSSQAENQSDEEQSENE